MGAKTLRNCCRQPVDADNAGCGTGKEIANKDEITTLGTSMPDPSQVLLDCAMEPSRPQAIEKDWLMSGAELVVIYLAMTQPLHGFEFRPIRLDNISLRNDCSTTHTMDSMREYFPLQTGTSQWCKPPTKEPFQHFGFTNNLNVKSSVRALLEVDYEHGSARQKDESSAIVNINGNTPPTKCVADPPPPPRKFATQMDDSPIRRTPLFPVLSHHVCFGWSHHRGTIQWQEIVKHFSDNRILYPKWCDTIADLVKAKAEDDSEDGSSTVFLVFLNAKGQPSDSIQEGLWYPATVDEILEKTRKEFQRNRGGGE